MTKNTATVELLTAEVRVLMVGSRQVTLSVYKQLDVVSPWVIDAFGRVRSGFSESDGAFELVGEYQGVLVRSVVEGDWSIPSYPGRPRPKEVQEFREMRAKWLLRYRELKALPLIVLAGLR